MNGRIEVSPWRVIVWWNDSCKQSVEERILSDLLRRPVSIIVSLSKTQLFSIHPFKCQLIQWFTLSLLVESLRMELEWFIGILSLFDDQLKWVVFAHLDNSVVDSIDSVMISFLWSEWGVEWVCQMLWHCGSEGYRLLLNEHYSLKTEWNLYSECVLLAWLWPLVMLNQSMNSFVKGNDLLILSHSLTLLR